MKDSVLGIIGLVTSSVGLLYLFITLILIPILPSSSIMDYNFDPSYQEQILLTLALSGLIFIGSLSVVTLHNFYKE